MLFERENARSFENPSEKRLRLELSRLRPYGPTTFAYLTAPDGSYVQVAGGTVLCAMEWRTMICHRHYRAFRDVPRFPVPEGTELNFGGGTYRLHHNAVFFIEEVADTFASFLTGQPFPSFVRWRDITDELSSYGIERP